MMPVGQATVVDFLEWIRKTKPPVRSLAPLDRQVFMGLASEDKVLNEYIKAYWNALDGLSGKYCHIFQSILQLKGGEDAYTFLEELSNVPGADELQIRDLPAFVLWSDSAHLVVSMRGFDES